MKKNKFCVFLLFLKFSGGKLPTSEDDLVPGSLGEIDMVKLSTRKPFIIRVGVLKHESMRRLGSPEPHDISVQIRCVPADLRCMCRFGVWMRPCTTVKGKIVPCNFC